MNSSAEIAALRIVVGGADGPMGRLSCAAIKGCSDLSLVGRLTRLDDPARFFASAAADIYLDFTVAAAARTLAPRAARAGLCPVVGTSGLLPDDLAELRSACREGQVSGLLVPNFSVGAVLQMRAAEQAAQHMRCAGIAEVHHKDKRDSPSGTARATALRVAQASGGELPAIDSERRDGFLAAQSVTFEGPHERLTLHHVVESREAYVPGLLLALRRVRSCQGLVVGLESLLD
ncbi:MAG: 4-hydroxy-tetrahydrodipicolinate reductase [Pseudohongiellaceae bacterium]|jgi:4-hydroxy-tetrahydrodipicolinate reductase